MPRAPARANVIDDLVAADLADPCEERGVTAEVRKFPHRLGQGGQHDFLGRFGVAIQARQRKPVHSPEIRVEESVERPLVAGKQSLD